jgi:hypothetical protein
MNTKNAILRGHVRTIEDAVETWNAYQDEIEKVRTIEDVVRVCLFLYNHLSEWQKETWERAFANKIKNIQETGETFRRAYSITKYVFAEVAKGIRWAENENYSVDSAAEFERAARDIDALSNDLENHWPFISPDDIKDGLAEAARGEGQSVEDIIRELQCADNAGS